jgi:predicted RND superfamily exporter protein
VPFLIFSIGVSHAVQMTKTWEREVVSGVDSLTAAKRSFAKLFIPGTLALLTNVLGFAVIMLIPIDIVRELGITASLGVAWMIITNKMLLPILLSHIGMSKGRSRARPTRKAACIASGRPRPRVSSGRAPP